MLLRRITTLLPVLAVVQAFKNAAPFLMFSSQSLGDYAAHLEVQSAETVEATISEYYSDSKARSQGRHLLVSQPGLTISDLRSMPKLAAVVNAGKQAHKLAISNVIGDLDAESVRYEMGTTLGEPQIITDKAMEAPFTQLQGDELPREEAKRAEALSALDTLLDEMLSSLAKTKSYTMVLISRPADLEESRYDMEETYQAIIHQDLKRNTDAVTRASNSTSNRTSDNFQDGLPLFERYSYFSPALFMGLMVSILLLIILYVALSAISGLEVSYMAFSKEMAPQNQKKEQ